MEAKDKFKEAKRLYETANADQRYVLESLFPELKMSDDERIKKHLISLFEKFVTLGVANECETPEIKVDDILFWLKSLRPQNRWKVVDKKIYVKEPALVQKKDKSEPCQGFVICYDHTLTPDVYERYIMLSDINCHSGWKPSDTEINILQGVIDGSFKPENVKVTLTNILEQLKKLREE